MFKIFLNGSLYKITKSKKCVDAIVDWFLSHYVKNTEIVVEKNGEFFEKYFHF